MRRREVCEVRAGPGWTGNVPPAPFINMALLRSSGSLFTCIHPCESCCDIVTSGFCASKGENFVDLSVLPTIPLLSFQTGYHHFTSKHVQLQLFPGQVWPGGEGAFAQAQRQELWLLLEDRILLLLTYPVPHHRQPGALPHLRATGEVSGGDESQGEGFDYFLTFVFQSETSSDEMSILEYHTA